MRAALQARSRGKRPSGVRIRLRDVLRLPAAVNCRWSLRLLPRWPQRLPACHRCVPSRQLRPRRLPSQGKRSRSPSNNQSRPQRLLARSLCFATAAAGALAWPALPAVRPLLFQSRLPRQPALVLRVPHQQPLPLAAEPARVQVRVLVAVAAAAALGDRGDRNSRTNPPCSAYVCLLFASSLRVTVPVGSQDVLHASFMEASSMTVKGGLIQEVRDPHRWEKPDRDSSDRRSWTAFRRSRPLPATRP